MTRNQIHILDFSFLLASMGEMDLDLDLNVQILGYLGYEQSDPDLDLSRWGHLDPSCPCLLTTLGPYWQIEKLALLVIKRVKFVASIK